MRPATNQSRSFVGGFDTLGQNERIIRNFFRETRNEGRGTAERRAARDEGHERAARDERRGTSSEGRENCGQMGRQEADEEIFHAEPRGTRRGKDRGEGRGVRCEGRGASMAADCGRNGAADRSGAGRCFPPPRAPRLRVIRFAVPLVTEIDAATAPRCFRVARRVGVHDPVNQRVYPGLRCAAPWAVTGPPRWG